MSEHTPGPWKAKRRNWRGEEVEHKIYISGNEHESQDDDKDKPTLVATGVCIVEGNATSQEVTEANAALIAAAPDLLATLRAMVTTWEAYLTSPSHYRAYHEAKALIKKCQAES